MTSYYDEETETSYYENTIVVEFRQIERDTNKVDMRVFMLYDAEDELMYLYGSRKSNEFQNYTNFLKKFNKETIEINSIIFKNFFTDCLKIFYFWFLYFKKNKIN